MKIVKAEGLVLREPGATALDQNPTREVFLVRLHAEDGSIGLGECNHHPAGANVLFKTEGFTTVGRGVAQMLKGLKLEDPRRISAWLYDQNYFWARRGVGKGVLAATDVALWDLWAQSRGEPLWRTLWGERASAPLPYGTVYTGAAPFDEALLLLKDLLQRMRSLGYRALKIEPLIDCAPEDKMGLFVAAARAEIGPDVPLLVDFGYRMPTAARALAAIAAMAESKPYAIETPCEIDAFTAWTDTARDTPVPIAGAELYEHEAEFAALVEAKGASIIQPWINRLGVTGVLSAIAHADQSGARTILAGYNTTAIANAAALHVAAGLPQEGIALEHAPTEVYAFPLRALASPDLGLRDDGRLPLPEAPGLGVTLDQQALDRYRVF